MTTDMGGPCVIIGAESDADRRDLTLAAAIVAKAHGGSSKYEIVKNRFGSTGARLVTLDELHTLARRHEAVVYVIEPEALVAEAKKAVRG